MAGHRITRTQITTTRVYGVIILTTMSPSGLRVRRRWGRREGDSPLLRIELIFRRSDCPASIASCLYTCFKIDEFSFSLENFVPAEITGDHCSLPPSVPK